MEALLAQIIVLLNDLVARIARLENGVSVVPRAEQERQRELYRNLWSTVPMPVDQQLMELSKKYGVELRHPDLLYVPLAGMIVRDGGNPLGGATFYGVAEEDRIMWNGRALRNFPGGDGGQGMFGTPKQLADWPHYAPDSTTIGG